MESGYEKQITTKCKIALTTIKHHRSTLCGLENMVYSQHVMLV